MLDSTPRCLHHPAVAANLTCSRCGSFVCRACIDHRLGYCVTCAQRPEFRGLAPASPRAWAALVCTMAGLFGAPPASLIALVLLRLEWSDLAAGKAPPGSRTIIGGLQPVAVISIVLWVFFYLAFFGWHP